MHEWTLQVPANRKCSVRFGINEAVDTLITDVNARRNVAGAGINQAQRLMTIADGNQIILGRAAFDSLSVHDDYIDAFRELQVEVKHGQILTGYQFVRDGLPFLNTDVPIAVQRTEPIDLAMAQALSERANFSTSGQVASIHDAIEKWEKEMESILAQLASFCTAEQAADLLRTQASWEKYRKAEMNWRSGLRRTVFGTMYRVLAADIDLQLVRKRVMLLRLYLDEWLSLAK